MNVKQIGDSEYAEIHWVGKPPAGDLKEVETRMGNQCFGGGILVDRTRIDCLLIQLIAVIVASVKSHNPIPKALIHCFVGLEVAHNIRVEMIEARGRKQRGRFVVWNLQNSIGRSPSLPRE